MNIVLEGPKACGKSTIAQHFIEKGYDYFHSSNETANDLDYHLQLLNGNNRVIDRFSVGEMIYPHVYGRDGKLDHSEFEKTICDPNALLVVMFSSDEKELIKRIQDRDGEFDKDSLLNSNFLFEKFATALNGRKNVLVFDISQKSTVEIIKSLEEFTNGKI